MCSLFLFLFQAKKIVRPERIPKYITILDNADMNVSSQAGIKDGEKVNVFKNLVFLSQKRNYRVSLDIFIG